MSQVGACIDELPEGTSWALIAYSALNHSGDGDGTGASGILAASSDIAQIVLSGSIGDLFIFPTDRDPPGLYLWQGTVEHEPELYCEGQTERLHPDYMQTWIDRNGEAP